MKDLAGKNIAVMGGNGLLGSAIVNHLLLLGAHPVCVDIKNDSTDKEVKFISFDLTRLNRIENFIETFIEKENIHGLVNASFARAKGWKQSPSKIEWDEWQANIDSQLNSVCLASLSAANTWMKNKKTGVIVNLSSIFGVIAPPIHLYDNVNSFPALPYPAIKGGVISFTRFLAAKFGTKNIRANCISPGAIEGTPMQSNDTFIQGMKKNMLGRIAKPEEIAKPVCFLLSEDSSFITGQNIIVDGGWTNI